MLLKLFKWTPEFSLELCEMVKDRKAWRAGVHGVTESGITERLNNKSSLKAVSFTDGYLTIDRFRRTESGSPTPLSCSWSIAFYFYTVFYIFFPFLYRFSEICLFPFQNMLFNICGSWKNWPSCSLTSLPSALNMGDLWLLWLIE